MKKSEPKSGKMEWIRKMIYPEKERGKDENNKDLLRTKDSPS